MKKITVNYTDKNGIPCTVTSRHIKNVGKLMQAIGAKNWCIQ